MNKETISDIKQLPTPSVPNIDNINYNINKLTSIPSEEMTRHDTNLLDYYTKLSEIPLNPTERNLEQQIRFFEDTGFFDMDKYVEELYNMCFIKIDKLDPKNNKHSQIKQISSLMGYVLDKYEVVENMLALITSITQTKSDRQTFISNFVEYWTPDEDKKQEIVSRMTKEWHLTD